MARRTKKEAEETRQTLLDAAEEVFYTQGVSKTTLDQIAERAGTTRGAIYWHFKDKTGLMDAMTERIGRPIIESIEKLIKDRRDDHLLMVTTIFLQPLRIVAQDEQARRVVLITSQLLEYSPEIVYASNGRSNGKQGALLQYKQSLSNAASDHGFQLQVPPSFAAQGLCSLFFGLLESWVLEPDSFDLVETARAALYIYLNGMGFGEKMLDMYGLRFKDKD